MIRCTVGVMAYNEEQNIVQVLHALLQQEVTSCILLEIIVVASGCTDRTVELAQRVARAHPQITVEVQPVRAGKAAALNHLISLARGEVIVLVGADTLPDPMALEHLVQPFADPSIGMTGARVVPLNDPRTLSGLVTHILWRLHHRLALRWPKLGELVAFRNIIPALPTNTATDEAALEALITARGYRLAYAPLALVYNRGPETFNDFLLQRRRIYAGHLHIAATYGYVPASMPIGHLLMLGWEFLRRRPGLLPWTILAALLEGWARACGWLDFRLGHEHHIWRMISSTKAVQQQQSLTLLIAQFSPGSIRPAHILRKTRHWTASQGAVLWWDYRNSQVLLLLPDDAGAAASPEIYIQALAACILKKGETDTKLLSYRIMKFASPLPQIMGYQEQRSRPYTAPAIGGT